MDFSKVCSSQKNSKELKRRWRNEIGGILMLYLGIDLSLTKTGWAIIEVKDRKPSVVDFGLLKTTADLTDGERLQTIVNGLHAIIKQYPDIHESVAREAGIVKFPKPTMQVFKAHGAFEYALVDYSVEDVPLA